jgi:hypothetical protein
MAEVYLRSDGGKEISKLPRVCMKCGAPATVRKSKLFVMLPNPHEDFLTHFLMHIPLANIVVFTALTKRQRVETPFCDKHENYWWNFPLLMWMLFLATAGFAPVAVLGTAAVLKGANVEPDAANAISWIAGFSVALVGLTIIFVLLQLNKKRIRPTEITSGHICLTNVSPAFDAAVKNQEANRT